MKRVIIAPLIRPAFSPASSPPPPRCALCSRVNLHCCSSGVHAMGSNASMHKRPSWLSVFGASATRSQGNSITADAPTTWETLEAWLHLQQRPKEDRLLLLLDNAEALIASFDSEQDAQVGWAHAGRAACLSCCEAYVLRQRACRLVH